MEAIVVDDGLGFVEDISHRLLVDVVKDEPGPHEQRLRWTGGAATGYASTTRVRPGMNLLATDVRGGGAWEFDMLHQPTGLELGFSRSCGVRVSDERGVCIGHHQGSFGVFQIKEPVRLRCSSTGAMERGVRLMVEPELLCEMFGYGQLPRAVSDVLMSADSMASNCFGMTPRMFDIIDEITGCQMMGPMRHLFLESKSLELISLAMDAMERPEALPTPDGPTADRLEHARAILLDEMCDPPSLRELARRTGLNERKLKEGFKQRFGTTVFGFVRHQRMSHAHDMLLAPGRSVTEVAQRVGYANPSKFAAAFRREFGIQPSSLVQA